MTFRCEIQLWQSDCVLQRNNTASEPVKVISSFAGSVILGGAPPRPPNLSLKHVMKNKNIDARESTDVCGCWMVTLRVWHQRAVSQLIKSTVSAICMLQIFRDEFRGNKISKFSTNLPKRISRAHWCESGGSALEAAEGGLGMSTADWPFWAATVRCIVPCWTWCYKLKNSTSAYLCY